MSEEQKQDKGTEDSPQSSSQAENEPLASMSTVDLTESDDGTEGDGGSGGDGAASQSDGGASEEELLPVSISEKGESPEETHDD